MPAPPAPPPDAPLSPLRVHRRGLLGAGLALGGLLAFPRLLRAGPAAASPPRRTVVLLHLVGGNDGLNTLVPLADRAYARLRPSLALDRSATVPFTQGLALHRSLTPLLEPLARGELAVVAGVGYPRPDYSHFRATEIWHSAEPERAPRLGWVGRALDARATPAPLRAVALSREQPLALAATSPAVATLTDFGRFRLPAGLERAAAAYAPDPERHGAAQEVAEAGARALGLAERLARLAPAAGPFEGTLGDDLRRALALLEAASGAGGPGGGDLSLEALHLSFGGFDTHAAQARTHGELLGLAARNLAAWQARLLERRLSERVVTVVYSEFGRRVEENASAGTDHGSAGPVLVLGAGVVGGLHGSQPSLDGLDDGNLRFTTDFRRLYAALARHAWDLDPEPLLGSFAPLELFR